MNFFGDGELKCFHCLLWIFDSGSKWWTQVSSWITNLRWKFFGLAWNRIRIVLEMSTLSSLCCGISILKTHLADSSLILKISVKIVCTESEQILMDLAIYLTVRCLPSKTIQWISSNCLSVVGVFRRPDWKSPSALSLPRLNSPTYFLTVIEAFSKYLYYVLMEVLGCHTFLFCR